MFKTSNRKLQKNHVPHIKPRANSGAPEGRVSCFWPACRDLIKPYRKYYLSVQRVNKYGTLLLTFEQLILNLAWYRKITIYLRGW
jgi:hypothetical protein